MPVDPIMAVFRNWWAVALYGVFAIIFGLVCLFSPLNAMLALIWIIGVFALADGIISIILIFREDSGAKLWPLIYGILSIIFGILALANPVAIGSILMILFAIWLIVAGVFRVIIALQTYGYIKNKWLLVLSGLLAIILGILLLIQPVTGMIITTIWIGAFVLVYGILQLIGGFKLRKT